VARLAAIGPSPKRRKRKLFSTPLPAYRQMDIDLWLHAWSERDLTEPEAYLLLLHSNWSARKCAEMIVQLRQSPS
jgi:hypothetical protein